MVDISWIGFLRRKNEIKNKREFLQTASSYYIPEGRFYSAPLVLKHKNNHPYLAPIVLGLGLAICSVSTIQNVQNAGLVQVKTTTFARSLNDISNILQQDAGIIENNTVPEIDEITTASTKLSKKYRALPVSDEKIGKKLGVSDPNPDENRINRIEKTSSLVQRESKLLPNLKKQKMTRVDVQMLPQASDGKYVTTMLDLKPEGRKSKVALTIVPPPKPKTLPIPTVLASLVTNKQADVLALAYVPEPKKYDSSPFDSIMSGSEKKPLSEGRFVPPIGEEDHAWAATPLPADSFSDKQQQCLAEAIYFESRGEPVKGQAAVAQVVLNRVRNPAYPNDICGVVYQNITWRNQCQFSFACDGIKHRVTEIPQWTLAKQVAKAVSAGQIWLPEIGSATHYHATYVRPNWARTMTKMDKIGQHIFYRTIGGGWS